MEVERMNDILNQNHHLEEESSLEQMLTLFIFGSLEDIMMEEIYVDERRLKILNAAKQVFSLFGYKGTTVEHIAKTAGISKGAIYLFFETKEDILKAIIHNVNDDLAQTIDDNMAIEGTIHEKLHHTIQGCMQFRKDHELLNKLEQEAAEYSTEASKNALAEINCETVHFIASRLEKAEQENLIQVPDKLLTAFLLCRMYEALVFEWEKFGDPLSADEVLEQIKRFIL